MNLDRVTITGADDSIHPQALADLSGDYPFAEWGILYSARHAGSKRFPSPEWLEQLHSVAMAHPDMKLSLHLCGGLLRGLLRGEPLPNRLADGYQRMQLNFHGEPITYDLAGFCMELAELAEKGAKEFIFQIDGNQGQELIAEVEGSGPQSFRTVPLFDLSHGAGVLPTEWPVPFYPELYHGYAGGLGPDNLAGQIPRIAAAAGDNRFWIDMETRVRSPDDRVFDLDKVEQCLRIAAPFVSKVAA